MLVFEWQYRKAARNIAGYYIAARAIVNKNHRYYNEIVLMYLAAYIEYRKMIKFRRLDPFTLSLFCIMSMNQRMPAMFIAESILNIQRWRLASNGVSADLIERNIQARRPSVVNELTTANLRMYAEISKDEVFHFFKSVDNSQLPEFMQLRHNMDLLADSVGHFIIPQISDLSDF